MPEYGRRDPLPGDDANAQALLEWLGERLSLTAVTSPSISGGILRESAPSMPGLLLAGFTDEFPAARVQILGKRELTYLSSVDEESRDAALDRLCTPPVPCIIVCGGVEPPDGLTALGERRGVPVFVSALPADEVVRELAAELEDRLAPQTLVHGTLVDVYGVGLLFTGKSGIGKSECGLDLVANGHRLVADDAVTIMRTHKDYLIGYGNEVLGSCMEIRGVGIIDVQAMFGARAVRRRKRIEVEVKLAVWSDVTDYERLGFEDERSEILGVEIPAVTLPLVLGKNITVISEVIALNYLLKLRGQNAAKDFDRRQREAMARRARGLRAMRGDDE